MKPSFQTSVDVQKCMDFLENHKEATYSEIGKHLGRNIKDRDRYVLASARKQLERRGILFITERGVGIKRATNGQVATLSTAYPITRIQRISRKAEHRERHVNIQALSEQDRLAFNIGRAVIHSVKQSTLKSFKNRIAKELTEQGDTLISIQQLFTLPRFQGKKK